MNQGFHAQWFGEMAEWLNAAVPIRAPRACAGRPARNLGQEFKAKFQSVPRAFARGG
ncbi:MAG: hypothetical protein ACLQM8_03575 [Limisphaerales bacterium]